MVDDGWSTIDLAARERRADGRGWRRCCTEMDDGLMINSTLEVQALFFVKLFPWALCLIRWHKLKVPPDGQTHGLGKQHNFFVCNTRVIARRILGQGSPLIQKCVCRKSKKCCLCRSTRRWWLIDWMLVILDWLLVVIGCWWYLMVWLLVVIGCWWYLIDYWW